MTRIATVSGRIVDFLAPDPQELTLADMSVGLAQHPRYSGQTVRPHSVAQHSLLVATLVAPEHRLHALLHDAPEAYLCDVASPAKHAMRTIAKVTGHQSPYDVLERGLWKAICRRHDLSPDLPEEVTRADAFAMVIEAPVLQPAGWRREVWDFAREDEKRVAGFHRQKLLQICGLPGGAAVDWLWAVSGEAGSGVAP